MGVYMAGIPSRNASGQARAPAQYYMELPSALQQKAGASAPRRPLLEGTYWVRYTERRRDLPSRSRAEGNIWMVTLDTLQQGEVETLNSACAPSLGTAL